MDSEEKSTEQPPPNTVSINTDWVMRNEYVSDDPSAFYRKRFEMGFNPSEPQPCEVFLHRPARYKFIRRFFLFRWIAWIIRKILSWFN